jgi:hypothetical protein
MHDYSNEYQYYPPNTEHVPAYPPMDWIEMLEPELRQLDYERFLQRMNASMKKHEPIKQ